MFYLRRAIHSAIHVATRSDENNALPEVPDECRIYKRKCHLSRVSPGVALSTMLEKKAGKEHAEEMIVKDAVLYVGTNRPILVRAFKFAALMISSYYIRRGQCHAY